MAWQPPGLPLHFKEESISLCHPERSEGSLAGQRSFAALRMTLLPLRMTLLNRLRLTRNSSYVKCFAGKPGPYYTRSVSPFADILRTYPGWGQGPEARTEAFGERWPRPTPRAGQARPLRHGRGKPLLCR